MRSVEIFVAPEPSPSNPLLVTETDRGASSTRRPRQKPAREVLDVFIEGANVTARVADAQASCVLRDLSQALLGIVDKPHGKAIVRFYDDPWELSVERFGSHALLSVYRTGTAPEVAIYDRCVALIDIIDSTLDAISAMLDKRSAPAAIELELRGASRALRSARDVDIADTDVGVPSLVTVSVEVDRESPCSFGTDFGLRTPCAGTAPLVSVERTDLHALLFRGRLRAEIRGRSFDLGEGHPFLMAERLLELARHGWDAWERGVSYNVRTDVAGIVVGLRVHPDGKAALTLGSSTRGRGEERSLYTFPGLDVGDVVQAALCFGRGMVRALLRRDRSQCSNLRLSAFRRTLRETQESLREVRRTDSCTNPSPEVYRAFAETARQAGPVESRGIGATRLRYAPRWRALVPSIDLRSTFLCGDRIVVGSAGELNCLDRSTGEVLWRRDAERATSVVTPGGIARITQDGCVSVHDFGTGEISLRTRVSPRLGGPVAGAVVNLAGLPRLLIVTEGEQHLVAIDLMSGEPRWRSMWTPLGPAQSKARGVLRMKRWGKLLYFTSGDTAINALDVTTGAVVWRVRDRLRFRTAPALDHDVLYAVSGGMGSLARLHAIDPYSGHSRWTAPISGTETPCTLEGPPLLGQSTLGVVVREREGVRIVAFDRATGRHRFTTEVVAPSGTSWLAVDGLYIGNAPSGELLAIDTETGALRYRHVLVVRPLESDVPRRLEPVLRSGALFVPHADVQVIRPRDGVRLGSIGPCDAIPDLLRVDERCDVYVAEESGHLLSFSAQARLSLVR